MLKLKAHRRPPLIKDLRDMVYICAEQYGYKPYYSYRRNGKEMTMTTVELRDNMNCMGTAFAAKGLMGKRIAVIGDTCPEYMVTYYAAVNGGGVIVPLDKDLQDEQLINFINWSEASAIVYTKSFNRRLINYKKELPGIQYYIPIMEEDEIRTIRRC